LKQTQHYKFVSENKLCFSIASQHKDVHFSDAFLVKNYWQIESTASPQEDNMDSYIFAIERGFQVQVSRVLKKYPAWANTELNPEKDTPLIKAIKHGQFLIAHCLLDCGAQPSATDIKERTALHHWAQFDLPENTKVIKDEYVSLLWRLARKSPTGELSLIDSLSARKETPLFEAVARNRFVAVALLLHAGASPNILNSVGYAPIHAAIFSTQPTSTQLLYYAKVDQTIPCREGTVTELLDKIKSPNTLQLSQILKGEKEDQLGKRLWEECKVISTNPPQNPPPLVLSPRSQTLTKSTTAIGVAGSRVTTIIVIEWLKPIPLKGVIQQDVLTLHQEYVGLFFSMAKTKAEEWLHKQENAAPKARISVANLPAVNPPTSKDVPGDSSKPAWLVIRDDYIDPTAVNPSLGEGLPTPSEAEAEEADEVEETDEKPLNLETTLGSKALCRTSRLLGWSPLTVLVCVVFLVAVPFIWSIKRQLGSMKSQVDSQNKGYNDLESHLDLLSEILALVSFVPPRESFL